MAEKQVYNRFYTDEKWERVNKENKDILNDYIMEIKSKKLKPKSIAQYFNDGRIIMIYILEQLNNVPILNLKRKDFRNMSLFFVDNCGMSNARVNRLFAFVHTVLDYCEENSEDYDYDINASKKVRGLPKEPIREHTFLTDEQVHQISEELLKQDRIQENALLWVLYDTGARKNEVWQLNKPETKEQKMMNKVVAKRGKEYCPILLDKSREAVTLWLETRGEDSNEALFITGDKRMYGDTLYGKVCSWGDILSKIYNEEISLTTHSFRHSMIENFINGTHYYCKKVGKLPIEKVQKIVRHTDIGTTCSYLRDKGDEEVMELLGI